MMSAYLNHTIKERLKGFDRKYLGGSLRILKRLVNAGDVRSQINRNIGRLGSSIYHFSDRFAIESSRHRKLIPRSLRQSIARLLGDLGWLTVDLLKKDVWRMSDSDLQIVFVGSKECAIGLSPEFFDESVRLERIGDTSAFGLAHKTKKWLDEGCDLVICELSRIYPFRAKAPITFSVPQWVNQQITYPNQMNTLLAGNRYNNLRRHINRCLNAGYRWRFSQSRDDLDFFYERLYEPFIRSRHGNRGYIDREPLLWWDLWVRKANGGLVLVTKEDKTIAGTLCFVCDDVCYNIDIGVLDADEALLKQGINTYIFWSVAEWGKEQGAVFYDMGGSFGWRSYGTFRWKAKWPSRVIGRRNASRMLRFSANRISPPLREKINTTGFICESNDSFYSLILENNNAPLTESDLVDTIKRTQKEGLSGVCVIAPDSKPRFYQ